MLVAVRASVRACLYVCASVMLWARERVCYVFFLMRFVCLCGCVLVCLVFVSFSTLSFCALLFACLYVSASAYLCASLFTYLHVYLADNDSSFHVYVGA